MKRTILAGRVTRRFSPIMEEIEKSNHITLLHIIPGEPRDYAGRPAMMGIPYGVHLLLDQAPTLDRLHMNIALAHDGKANGQTRQRYPNRIDSARIKILHPGRSDIDAAAYC